MTEPAGPLPPPLEVSPTRTESDSIENSITPEEAAFLNKCGFSLNDFRQPGYTPNEMLEELRWCLGRLNDLNKAFDDPMAKSLAKQCVFNELIIHRLDKQISRQTAGCAKFSELQKEKRSIELTFQKQYKQLEELCPFVKAATIRQHFSGVISEIIDGVKQYKSRRSNEIIDGLFTSLEIQVECRESVHDEVRCSPALVAAVQEAKKGGWNPKSRRMLPDNVSRMLDAGLQEGVRRLNEAHGTKLIDLESDSLENEYPPLVVPPSGSDGDFEEQQTDHEKVQEPVELQDYPEAHLNRNES